MEHKLDRNEEKLVVSLTGRLDTDTSPELEEVLQPELEKTKKMILDFANLEYISSAGLRLLLSLQKFFVANNGKLVIVNVNDFVKEVFEMTGFVDILNVEE